MANYKLVISYDGTAYHGFQFQDNALTIQELLEKCLKKVYKKRIKVDPAGRTDSGVHARGQTVNYFAPEIMPPERIPLALNRILPRDIVVLGADLVPDGFNARRDALAKIYSYTIDNGFFPDVFLVNYAWHLYGPLDLEAMRQGASLLLGKHDFKAFQASGGTVLSTERTLFSFDIKKNKNIVKLIFQGDGFLYKMARNIVGTLADVGLHRKKPQEIRKILDSLDRGTAGKTAPARGLCLEKVLY
ncbi:MAG: tRNA pseudouridine(38-40) synthase TruA [Firmicutes bacterium]|nr:tRNA pseudouridine(38-40) synthase TruA [Bacillota bacterium]